MKHRLSICLTITLIVGGFAAEVDDSLVISTPKGPVSGFERQSRGKRTYLGWTRIPYAKPPTGKLRFMPPEAHGPWTSTLDATQDITPCMQISYTQKITVSEDCLYLNVYRPKIDTSKQLLPVLVYIHGGAFLSGNPGGRQYADFIMDEDVVLVEVSYRLNAFGFMTLGDEVMPGNYGMKDQVRALHWVNYTIKKFGGDPKNVTVFGESAGGASCHLLLKSPLSKGLIKGAVSHSGAINPIWTLLKAETVKAHTLAAANAAGCTQTDHKALLACLQEVEADKLLEAMQKSSTATLHFDYAPVIEPETVKNAFATEDLSLLPTTKPWMNTFTNGESFLFLTMFASQPALIDKATKDLPGFIRNTVLQMVSDPARQALAEKILEEIYITKTGNVTRELSQMLSDISFVYPAIYNAELHKGPTWVGQLEYSPLQEPGAPEEAPHASNVLFYFNYTATFPNMPGFEAASKRMIKYLVNFAYHDNPTPPGSKLIWPQFKTNEVMRFRREGDFVSDQLTFSSFENVKNTWKILTGW